MTSAPPKDTQLPERPGFGLTFLYYFSGTALVTTLLALKTLHVSIATGIPNRYGLIFGLVGGLVGAYFNHGNTLEVPYANRQQGQQRLSEALGDMGYELDTSEEAAENAAEDATRSALQRYHRSPLRRLFSGPIYVEMGPEQARVAGRAVHMRRLKRSLERG